MSSAHVLTLNAGSSSLKFGLFTKSGGDPAPRMTGLIERIGGDAAMTAKGDSGAPIAADLLPEADAQDHAGAIRAILALLGDRFPGVTVAAVGHRVVHGGPAYAAPIRLDSAALERLKAFEPFAPLHQPANLAGVRAAVAAFPDAVQVACFDTAFHRNHPFVNDAFALPRRFYEKGVRRYGFVTDRVDLAKTVFHLHSAGTDGSALFRRKVRRGQVLAILSRQPRCTVAMDACASAHH